MVPLCLSFIFTSVSQHTIESNHAFPTITCTAQGMMFNVGEYQNDIGIQCHISLPHKSDFLDGKTTTDEGFDFILLHAKKIVYKCRLNKLKPTLEAVINYFKHVYEVDKHVHLVEMTYERFITKWTPCNPWVI